MADKQTYPMISEKNWWKLRDQFKKTLPATVNASYVMGLFGFQSDISARTHIISPLKLIGLIDAEGKPTSLANDWRSDEKYPIVCQTLLKAIYPQVLLDLFPDEIVDLKQVIDSFQNTAALGENAARQAANFFILLKDAKIKQDQSGSKKSHRKESAKPVSSKHTASQNLPDLPVNQEASKTASPNLPSPTMHIDVQVHISPDASPEQIEKIFESMAKHLYGRN